MSDNFTDLRYGKTYKTVKDPKDEGFVINISVVDIEKFSILNL
jgi:hypothetical protein